MSNTLVIESVDHFVYAPSQWESTLHCNVASHWLGAYTKWPLEWRKLCMILIWSAQATLPVSQIGPLPAGSQSSGGFPTFQVATDISGGEAMVSEANPLLILPHTGLFKSNFSAFTWEITMSCETGVQHIRHVLWLLMAWCFSTSISAVIILRQTSDYVSYFIFLIKI